MLQIKPYLEVRRLGGVLRIGNMPLRGIELEEAPEFLDEFIGYLSVPRTKVEITEHLVSTAGFAAPTIGFHRAAGGFQFL